MMLVRLGNVLYWLGCILAALIIGAAIAEWFRDAQYYPNWWGNHLRVCRFRVHSLANWPHVSLHAVAQVRCSAEIGLADFRAIGELGRRPGSDHPTLR